MTRYLLTLCLALGALLPLRAAKPSDSIVIVQATIRGPNVARPWARGAPSSRMGTGVIIEGNRILTNAHLVHYAEEVEVLFRAGQRRHVAKIEGIAVDMDLAILSIKDEKFFKQHPPIPFAKKLPKVQDRVSVHGFPIGGETPSFTRGVISRIEHADYDNRGYGLRLQVSAPINPGNSGGPALVEGNMVGLVFGKLGEGIGYVIPNEEIQLFLKDVKDGEYHGKPRMQIRASFQSVTNSALREMLKLKPEVTGVMVSPGPLLEKDGPLQPFDVITHVGKHAIDSEGMVPGENGTGRIYFRDFGYRIVKNKCVPLTVIRKGKTIQIPVPVTREDRRLLREFRGEPMAWFLYGPLVLSRAKSDLIPLYRRMNEWMSLRHSPLVTRLVDVQKFPGEELVVVTLPAFQHKCIKGFEDPGGLIVKEINGHRIKNLKHLVEVLRDLKDEYVQFRFAELGAEVLVLKREDVAGITKQVMEDNGIPANRQMSPELMKVWRPKK